MKIKGKSALAEHFKVSRTTIDAWLRRGCPYEGGDREPYVFETSDVERWQRDRDRDRGGKSVRTIRQIELADGFLSSEADHRTPGQAIAETFAGAILSIARQKGKGWDFRTDPEVQELLQQLADTIDGVDHERYR
ncbi:MAG: hypothetical protein HPY65_00770 [Syntrophaceae bacterium]|nr:hypothetical protein [Syntrophaceae bacterium]